MKDIASTLDRYRPGKRTELKLFCFPYAGGGALIYRNWADELPPTVGVVPVELPGRGARLSEAPFTNLPRLINALAGELLPLLDMPFGFFGHSMGALIAFELARHLWRRYSLEPQILLVSGRRAPQLRDSKPVTYNLPKDEFIAELHRIAGTPAEVLEHAELMDLMVPVLRADFQLTQTYEYYPDAPLRCPVVAYGGLEDEVTKSLLLPWSEQTSSTFSLHMLPGGHFFLRSSKALFLGSVSRELCRLSVAHRVC